jgi:hypothetical protein
MLCMLSRAAIPDSYFRMRTVKPSATFTVISQ